MDIDHYAGQMRASLQSAIDECCFQHSAVFETPGHVWNIGASANSVACCARLKSLTFATQYSIADSELFPSWSKTQDAAPFSLDWQMPANMALWFTVFAERDGRAWTFDSAYLFALHPTAAGNWLLPTANMHADGTFCLGDGAQDITGATLPEFCANTLEYLKISPWNDDLSQRTANARRMFSWHWPTMQQLPVPARWYDYCTRVNHLDYARCNTTDNTPTPTATTTTEDA